MYTYSLNPRRHALANDIPSFYDYCKLLSLFPDKNSRYYMRPRPSVNIKNTLQMLVGFSCLLFHKGIVLLMLPMNFKGFNRLLWMYIKKFMALYICNN